MVKKNVDTNARKALEELKFEIASELGITDAFKRDSFRPLTNIFASSRVADIMNRKSPNNDDDFMTGG